MVLSPERGFVSNNSKKRDGTTAVGSILQSAWAAALTASELVVIAYLRVSVDKNNPRMVYSTKEIVNQARIADTGVQLSEADMAAMDAALDVLETETKSIISPFASTSDVLRSAAIGEPTPEEMSAKTAAETKYSFSAFASVAASKMTTMVKSKDSSTIASVCANVITTIGMFLAFTVPAMGEGSFSNPC